MGRFINADGYVSTGQGLTGTNMYAYCENNPINMEDSNGMWPKWITGAINVVSGALQVTAGAALGVTVGWTGVGAVAAGLLVVNGAATATQGVGQIVNSVSNSNVMLENNIAKTGVQTVGRAIWGDTGAKVAGGVYDMSVTVASIYSGVNALQQMGKIPLKVPISNVLNNPMDEFVTIGPKAGAVVEKIRMIQRTGQYSVYATKLSNGYFQIANGHHTVQALRNMGVGTINIYITK